MSKQQQFSLWSFVGLLAIFLWIVVQMIRPYLLAITMGGVLAFICSPLYRWLLRRRWPRSLAAGTTTIAMIVLIVGPFLVCTGLAVKQGMELTSQLANANISYHQLLEQLHSWLVSIGFAQPENVGGKVGEFLGSIGKSVSVVVLSMAKDAPEAVLEVFLASLTCFYMLMEGKQFTAWVGSRMPLSEDIRERLAHVFKDTAISVVWSSMAAAATQSLMMFFSFLILNIPAAFLAGGVTFVFAFIPILGSAPVWLSGMIYLYTQGQITQMIILLVLGLITGVVDNFVRPLVLKGRSEMHPLVSLVAIFGGIHLFGIAGVFMGPILAAILITLLQVWPVIGERYGLSNRPT